MPLLTGWANDGQYAAPDIGSSLSTNNFNVEKRYDWSDTLYWTHGNMLWKIGGDYNRARLSVTPFFAAAGGRWNFRRIQTNNSPAGIPGNNNLNGVGNGGNVIASFLLGVPNLVAYRPALFTYNYQWDSYAAFVQNDWKIKPNLTINLGTSLCPSNASNRGQQSARRSPPRFGYQSDSHRCSAPGYRNCCWRSDNRSDTFAPFRPRPRLSRSLSQVEVVDQNILFQSTGMHGSRG